jgi:hypothetical protein
LHDIFHIGPCIIQRPPYQARQPSWRDMCPGLIPGTIWIVQIDIVWFLFETRIETKIFANWTKATLLRIYFHNLSVQKSCLHYKSQCFIWMEIQFKFLHFLFNTTYTFEPIIPFQLNFIINYSNILKCVNLIEIQFLYAYFYTRPFLVFWHIMFVSFDIDA